MMFRFDSDYLEGAHPLIIKKLAETIHEEDGETKGNEEDKE